MNSSPHIAGSPTVMRNKLVPFGDFYIYQYSNHMPGGLYLIGHKDCPDKTDRFCPEQHHPIKCGACGIMASPELSILLKDALELIRLGLDAL